MFYNLLNMSRGYFLISCVLLMVNTCVGIRNGDMRLADGKLSNEGRVEIFYNGVWGTVCDDGWDIAEATVVCRHLNFPGASSALSGAHFGQGSGPILMDDLNCAGTEADLSSCSFKGWGVSDCNHGEDAGVVCEKASSKNITQEYSIIHDTNLSEQLGKLFDSGHLSDFNIYVTINNNTVETIYSHKVILSLEPEASFWNLSSLTLDVSSDCHPHVTKFIRYLYTRKIKISTTSALCIHKMASACGLKQLQEEAGKLFSWLLPKDPSFQSQASLYEYAVDTGDKPLQQTCLRYFAWNCEALVQSPTWTKLPMNAIKALLSRSDLVVPSETFVLESLKSWETAQGNASKLEDHFELLQYIRFSMIPAKALYNLKGARYQVGKLQGFQFHALPIGVLQEFITHWRAYTPRIYTASPWSFKFSSKAVNNYKMRGHYYSYSGQYQDTLSASFRTPVFNSGYFGLFRNMTWSLRLFVRSQECSNNGITCPAVRLIAETNNRDLPTEFQNNIHYKSKVILLCEDVNVVHVQDFKPLNNQIWALMPRNISFGQAYPCDSNDLSYLVVVRPKYTTGLKSADVDEEDNEE